jgi:hypothetical protein
MKQIANIGIAKHEIARMILMEPARAENRRDVPGP